MDKNAIEKTEKTGAIPPKTGIMDIRYKSVTELISHKRV
jgi:hypothetical protein